MRCSPATLALALAPMPAFAEVCDKVNETWQPGSAPIGFWPEVASNIMSPLGLVILLFCVAIAFTRLGWLQITVAAMLAAGAASMLVFEDPIIAAARAEGCVGSTWATLDPLLALATAMLARAMFLRKTRGEQA
jgi:hypothetical protein